MSSNPADPSDSPDAPPAEAPPESLPSPSRNRPGFKTTDLPRSPSLDVGTDDGSASDPGSAATSDEPRDKPSRKSGGSRTSSPVDSAPHLEEAIRTGVLAGTDAAHELLVRDPVAQDLELLVADEQDADGVAKPGSRLLARRLTSGINNPDLADGIELLIAVGAYVTKQLRKWREVRRSRLGPEPLGDLAADAGEPATP